MAIFPYAPCNIKETPFGCFFSDIINQVDQLLAPVVAEAAQTSISPSTIYDLQFVVNPEAGGGRLKQLIGEFERRAQNEATLRMVGRKFPTAHQTSDMAHRFASASRGHPWRYPMYLPMLSGDGGQSKIMDALREIPSAVAMPMSGVGTAQDISRCAGGASFTERLPHALTHSTIVPYYGVDVTAATGSGRHFHSIALGATGELFRLVEDVVDRYPFLTRLKKLSSALGIVPYLVAFVPLFKAIRAGHHVSELTVMQKGETVFKGRTCGVITVVVPGLGGVTRIPGVDPTHGQAKVIILPENPMDALKIVFEGVWYRFKSLIPGAQIPNAIASLAPDRQIALTAKPMTLTFSEPTTMQTNGDHVGQVSEVTMNVAATPQNMAVNRNSLLSQLAGTEGGVPSFESLLRMGEAAMLGVGVLGAVYPGINERAYRDLTHKMMVGLVHTTSLALLYRGAPLFSFHVRLLNLLPAYWLLQKGAEQLPMPNGKWRIFANTYLPLAAMSAMQYFRLTPSLTNVVRLIAPSSYVSLMGSRLVVGTRKSLLVRAASGLYRVGYVASLIVYFYQGIGDQAERHAAAADWLETRLRVDTAEGMRDWSRRMFVKAGLTGDDLENASGFAQFPSAEAEAELRAGMTPENWKELSALADLMQKINPIEVEKHVEAALAARPFSPNSVTADAYMRALKIDVESAHRKNALVGAIVNYDDEIISAAENPGLLGLAGVLDFHRRHAAPQPELHVLPLLLAALTSDNN